eukprot:CAMPEP_0113944748 /NCGR_PEP_ID=MMETSP1339-20121228/36407_1 /TAXON_ID=94617 /ORGANISM="Fibrocapsa japonica" /LENGTH=392 /DNA_ID=CAMNT_0000950057 /DNA_START=130 /DNA_END=1308 /DNA_ORIENTATION=+ /assembly_acc=CAM_ASM_000762
MVNNEVGDCIVQGDQNDSPGALLSRRKYMQICASGGVATAAILLAAPLANSISENPDYKPGSSVFIADNQSSMTTIPTAESGGVGKLATEFISGLASGAAQRITKGILLHPIDTIKTRLQVDGKAALEEGKLFENLYSGVLPPLVAGVPAASVFFGTKDFVKEGLNQALGASSGQYRQLTTVAAVAAANVPYWAIKTPAELVKTRRQAGLEEKDGESLQRVLDRGGPAALYKTLLPNFVYAFPADATKFLIYDTFKQQVKDSRKRANPGSNPKLSPVEAAVAGAISSAIAQGLLTPLDVVRTRIMTQKGPKDKQTDACQDKGAEDEDIYNDVAQTFNKITNEEGFQALFAGLTPRVGKALLSGAIQFGSYEIVKNLFGESVADFYRGKKKKE